MLEWEGVLSDIPQHPPKYEEVCDGEQECHTQPLTVYLLNGGRFVPCRMMVTNFRIVLSRGLNGTGECMSIPTSLIDSINEENINVHQYVNDNSKLLEIQCKNTWTFTLRLDYNSDSSKELYEKAKNLIIDKHKSTYPVENRFCFVRQLSESNQKPITDLYSLDDELYRMADNFSGLFRVSLVNKDYGVCESYPRKVIVPAVLSDVDLMGHAEFRARNRFLMVSWIDKRTSCCIARSSQPKVGLSRSRSQPDEDAVRKLAPTQGLASNIRSNIKTRRQAATEIDHLSRMNQAQEDRIPVTIIDARPWKAAIGNLAKGGGYEDESIYKCAYMCQGVEDCHTVQSSLEQLRKVINVGSKNWRSQFSQTKWLEHIESILAASQRVVSEIQEQRSVLVHCSNGWDRTTQIVSLAMLQCDSYFRTYIGFQTLIQKEWCDAGFRFGSRCGNGGSSNRKDLSPVFLQFVECVWHLIEQHPTSFEFTEGYLIKLLDAVYSCKHVDFIHDNKKSRDEFNSHHGFNLSSYWDELSQGSVKSGLLNIAYVPTSCVLFVRTHPRYVNSLWNNYHCRYIDHWQGGRSGVANTYSYLSRLSEVFQYLAGEGGSTFSSNGIDRRGSLFCNDSIGNDIQPSEKKIFSNSKLNQSQQGLDAEHRRGVYFSSVDVRWVPDALAPGCSLCQANFTIFRRRHHCRACGQVLCSLCSSARKYLPLLGHNTTKVRVCDACRNINGPKRDSSDGYLST